MSIIQMFFSISKSILQATGGTIVDSGGFRTHTFTSPGTFEVTGIPPGTEVVEYLIVAGGGGGGSRSRETGGGGGGGLLQGNFSVSVTTYPVVIGGGGAWWCDACNKSGD